MTPLCKVEMTPPSALGGPVPPLGMTDFRHVTKCRGGSGPGFLGSFDAPGSMGVPGKDGSPGRDGGSGNSGDTGEKGADGKNSVRSSRDTRALHLKLDELIRVNAPARNSTPVEHQLI